MVDDRANRLTLTHAGLSVTLLVGFNQQNEIGGYEPRRYFSNAGLQPWVGQFAQVQRRHCLLVPLMAEGSSVVDGQRRSYARFFVQQLEYC